VLRAWWTVNLMDKVTSCTHQHAWWIAYILCYL